MENNSPNKDPNKITVDGLTFKTEGNIVFSDVDENPFHLAQSPLLDDMDSLLENGMALFLKKANPSVVG
ncbi:MAG: hypothetical protein HQ596_03690 [Candidatus Saganbacteria bacterium]|nr:hypothetical protein [Candidatus Saganbacteria bacterium]